MGLQLTGYVLEPVRVGQSNSVFTSTPDIAITNQAAYDAAFPTNESQPRVEYLVFVLGDGDFPSCTFCWTKNEVIQRFDYDGKNGRFRPLFGAPRELVGTLSASSNMTRISVPAPISQNLATHPIRVAVGPGSGTTFTVSLVNTDMDFGAPGAGTVELSLASGNLNWAAADLVTFASQEVRFQRQAFYTSKESTGRLGLIDDTLFLNPKLPTGQFPLVRIGFSTYLTPNEKATEGAFSADPAPGIVEWAVDTGRLKFNSTDTANNAGRPVYYDGSVFSFGSTVSTIDLDTVSAPGVIAPMPSETSGVFFRVPGVVQFQQTVFVDTLSAEGKRGRVEIRRSDGQVQFSLSDRVTYGPLNVQAVIPDLTIERGLSLRMYRTPVDLTAVDPSLKDVSATHTSANAKLADPIVGAPFVFLPAVPVDSLPITVRVEQGTGTFTGVLPRLDTPAPPAGLGYIIDFDAQQLRFASRKSQTVISPPAPYGAASFADPLWLSSNVTIELEDSISSNTYTALVPNQDVLIDYDAGSFRLLETSGAVITSGLAASFAGTTFTDTTQNFQDAGVQPGDYLVVLNGASKGVFTITTVNATDVVTDLAGQVESNLQYEIRRGSEILADRFFKEVPPVDPNTKVERIQLLGAATNMPRLLIDKSLASKSRIRFGKTTFTNTVVVANDASFTNPAMLAAGNVEVSSDTGNLNFSSSDLGKEAYWARTLVLGIEYRIQPALGFIEFTDRLLEDEEVHVTYSILNTAGEIELIEERATFIARKELTASHPEPTDTLSFNPAGRELSSLPAPRAYRGGRPQITGQQVSFDLLASTVTFLPSDQLTDALPSGQVIQPNERVYIDYYTHEAFGGEKNLTVLKSPMLGTTVTIAEGETSFIIAGNRLADFPANHLLKVDSEVYVLAAPTYDGAENKTTVNLQAPQRFKSDLSNPSLAVSSGPTRTAGTLLLPTYFVTEVSAYETVARGENKFLIAGDVTTSYRPGTVVLFTDNADIFDLNIVDGATFVDGTTTITLASNGERQYRSGVVTLRRSVRPILPSPSAASTTARSPELTLPYHVFRRVEGGIGSLLVLNDDYTIDASGRIAFVDPLQDNEALGIFYSGDRVINDRRRVRASYTHTIAPDAINGLKDQILEIDYTTYAPDSFFWRVETITNFRAELAEKYEDDAQAGTPSGGPRLENMSSPTLYEQGRESLFFQEKHLANEDFVARATLKFYNDGINYLEDALQNMDGRVVGDHDGRFIFDGNVGNPPIDSYANSTNHIDDRIKVSPAPFAIAFPPFSITSIGTYRELYKASTISRFYPTRRSRFGVTANPAGLATGDAIMDIGSTNIRSVENIFRRFPWAVVTEPANAGSFSVTVDDADGSSTLLRPAFGNGFKVAIQRRDGVVLVPDLAPLEVAAVAANSLTFTAMLPASVPVGATIRLATTDTLYRKFYRLWYDVGIDQENGLLTHIEPFPPFDGSVAGFPPELEVQNPGSGEVLELFAAINNVSVEPDRFPALDGGTTDDDGNRRFPILGPSPFSEASVYGYLHTEQTLVEPAGTIRSLTTPPFVGTGDLDVTRTIITNDSGVAWPAPVPKVNDLVEIRSGLNAMSGYYRIVAVGMSTITVLTPFPVQDTGFSFTITVSNTLVTGAAATFMPADQLNDPAANFLAAGVAPGHTVVVTSGAFNGLRRQVVQVLGANDLVIEALPGTTVADYRVDNPLSTYGGNNSVIEDNLVPVLAGQLANLSTNAPPNPWAEQEAVERFIDGVINDVLTSAQGSTSVGQAVLTDLSVNFVAAGIDNTHYVYIRSGPSAGIYKVAMVTSTTTLTIDTVFPSTTAGISYRIVSVDAMSRKTLEDAFSVLLDIDTAILNVNAFLNLVLTLAPVVDDAGAFATRLLTSDLDIRDTQIDNRLSEITDPASGAAVILSSLMTSGDRLYDRRYAWIDARINLETGILPKKDRAVAERIKTTNRTLNLLTKILTTRP